jgi:hypothetical protein
MKKSERAIDERYTKALGRRIYKPNPNCKICQGTGTQVQYCEALTCIGHEYSCNCIEEGWDVEKQKWDTLTIPTV